MKKNKQDDQVNNQEDEDSSAYPLYRATEDIYNQSKNEGELDADSNTEIADPTSVIKDWHDKEFDADSLKSELDVPGADLDDTDKKTGREDEENDYYSIGGDEHNDLEEDNEG
jgi:hypothetical protein